MSHVLYRKYRSQSFDELVGQEHITGILKKAVKSGKIAHAYLFVGSRGTGKTSTARILAKAVNCTNLDPNGNPCNECSSCVSITNGNFLDLIEIDAASNRGIDQIRELKEKIEFSPNEGTYKVYIIDEVHMLTTEAFNALLKTLEEPPSHVIFILATTDVHKLPATILSRCQRYDFRLGSTDEVRELIKGAAAREGVNLADGALEILVQNANGSYRDALSLLDVVVSGQAESEKPEEVSESEVRLILGIPDLSMVNYMLESLTDGEFQKALELLNELESRGVNLQQFVKYILVSLRQILIGKMKGEGIVESYPFSEKLTIQEVLRMVNLFLDAERKIRSTPIPALVLEMVVATFAQDSSPTVKPVVKDNPIKGGDKSKPKVSAPTKETSEGSGDEEKVKSKEESGTVKASASSEAPVLNESPTVDIHGLDLEIEDIKEGWDIFMKNLHGENPHLHAFLKLSKVKGLSDGALQIEVPFQFHKDRIESPKVREFVNGLIKESFGIPIPFKCTVNASVTPPRKQVTADVILKSAPVADVKIESKEVSAKDAAIEAAQQKRREVVNKKLEAIFADV